MNFQKIDCIQPLSPLKRSFVNVLDIEQLIVFLFACLMALKTRAMTFLVSVAA